MFYTFNIENTYLDISYFKCEESNLKINKKLLVYHTFI